MATVGTAYVQIVPSAQGIKGNIEKELDPALASAGASAGGKLTSALGSAVKIGGAAMFAGISAAATGIAALGKEAVQSYADYEQLTGGIETLYGDAFSAVMADANEAFRTAGVSTNDYMEMAIQSGAAMISSLGGDTEKAGELMNTAIIDMADNVNKMGTSMEAVQNAYRGFSRGNFTMLDNLALGFAGTKEGMQQLLDKAQEISGVEFNIDSYADIVEAIHVVQESMGIAGTTMKEAEGTISGSINSMKAAWANLLIGVATGDDISGLVSNLISSAQTVLGNLAPIIEQAINGIGTAITAIIDSGAIQTGIDSIMGMLPQLLSAAGQLAVALVGALIQAAPQILEAAAQLILSLIQGISGNIPQILATMGELLSALWGVIVEYGPQLLAAGFELIVQLGAGILSAVGEVVGPMAEVAAGAIQAWGEKVKDFVNAGIQVISGIVEGIKSAASQVWDTLWGIISGAVDKVKAFFGIKSPSKLFAYFGRMIDEGFAKGIEDNVGTVAGAMDTITDQTSAVTLGVQRASASGLGLGSGLSGINAGNLGQLASAIVNGLSATLGNQGGGAEAAIYMDGDRVGRAMLPSVRKWSKITPEVSFG